MKILISSLQVSQSGSKGHLHPAVELALAAQKKSHEVAILPIPSRLGAEDAAQLVRANIKYIEPPMLPHHVIKTPNELAQMAADSSKVHLAYSSFLIDPIEFQIEGLRQILKEYTPDIILYDMLVYPVPLLGRELGIPDVGYCAGLKLIAPDHLLGTYAEVAKKLQERRDAAVKRLEQKARFHQLELLSDYGQMVFAPETVFANEALTGHEVAIGNDVKFVGALPISPNRSDRIGTAFRTPKKEYVVLSFGSVLDPADYPKLTLDIITACERVGYDLLIGSKKMVGQSGLPAHVQVYDYLPLSSLIPSAAAYIHHGGANSFSEAISLAARQILVPLTTDQPIQAHYLKKFGFGIAIHPTDSEPTVFESAFSRLADPHDAINASRSEFQNHYLSSSGSTNAIRFLEMVERLL